MDQDKAAKPQELVLKYLKTALPDETYMPQYFTPLFVPHKMMINIKKRERHANLSE